MTNDALVDEVLRANQALPRLGLVTMHSGNVSGCDRDTGQVLIKPSGVDYEALDRTGIARVKLADGTAIDGLRPSVDLPHHLFLYRSLTEIGGVVHTHSNFATAFAVLGKPIPCALTSVADEFGGEIPCAPYVDNEGEHIGEAILAYRVPRCPAILLANHGVFAWGPTPSAALKAAAMVEDAAKTLWLALQMGAPLPLSPEEIEKWWGRYHTTYGQGQ